jgi:hypothetical protein
LIKSIGTSNPYILERVLFKHATKDVFILAEAYDGEQIKSCTINFLKASNDQNIEYINHHKQKSPFGGDPNLISYIGHEGLIDFELDINYNPYKGKREVIYKTK